MAKKKPINTREAKKAAKKMRQTTSPVTELSKNSPEVTSDLAPK